MTAPHDPDECERLVREARQPNMKCTACTGLGYTMYNGPISGDWTEPCEPCNVTGLQSITNQGALADQLEAARAEIEHWREARRVALEGGDMLKAELDRMRPVVEAAVAWREASPLDAPVSDGGSTAPWVRAYRQLELAVDAYRASKP